MTVKERLKDFIKVEKITVKAFEESLEMSNGYVNSISKGIGDAYMRKLIEKYPNLNIKWLLTGEGQMLNSEEDGSNESIDEAERTETITLTPKNSIRYYPELSATASNIEDMPMEAHPYFELMYIKGLEGCLAIPATGRSMEPTIHAGDIVIHEPYLDRFVQNGEIYVVCTSGGQRMIKRLVLDARNEDGTFTYICMSDNADQQLYAPFRIESVDIRALYRVRRIIPISL